MTVQQEISTLIVDDQADVRMLLRLLIDAANDGLVVVGEAASGAEAIESIDAQEPLVVILDEMMPNMTGTETANRVRKSRPSQILILCTAYLDEAVIARARAVGMDGWLDKQEITQLPELIRSVVAQRN
ncbi:MAG: response regulator transcription factor [Frankiaceae bacterium]|nr:response regulator transcription factor [Frankiaceae bacterium]MBV9368305.1 response regulator transcription factor [Frankiales bacterium]